MATPNDDDKSVCRLLGTSSTKIMTKLTKMSIDMCEVNVNLDFFGFRFQGFEHEIETLDKFVKQVRSSY